jgi:polysaccharide biosynthesis/export protein
VCCASALAGCSTLPSIGPSASQIEKSASADAQGFRMVQVTPAIPAEIAESDFQSPAVGSVAGPADKVGVDDVLQITVWETGLGLFSSGMSGASGASGSAPIIPGNAIATQLTPVTVGLDGGISIPYVGRIQAAGLTVEQLRQAIEAQLVATRFASQPQVAIAIVTNQNNTIIVAGDVHTPGRFPLTQGPERLLDVIALAGNCNHTPYDTIVTLTRGDKEERMRLGAIDPLSPQNAVLEAGDRVYVDYEPRSYTVYGASLKPSEVTFDTRHVTLAQAVARVSGLNDDTANPRGVYLFRFEHPDVAKRIGLAGYAHDEPTIYHVDLAQPGAYFTMQQFMMRDRDVIYVANAGSAPLHKFLELLSAAFIPLGTAGSVSTAVK